ncbi:peptide chain release factor-like protein [Trebonia kvetii]|uniref:peptide chain release factor-like protein n=1 Tax=Trebonia kvetii TaxID=2480626 RepID=UPI001651E809|nr:peptide chain release factor-like protein [Trebonia kvetii]
MHVETARGTGPGGQHRNTRDTAVRAWHEDYPDIVITRNSGRSQTVNVDDALADLAERIAELHQSVAMAAVNAQRRAQMSGSKDVSRCLAANPARSGPSIPCGRRIR